MIIVFTGDEGSGKSLAMARQMTWCRDRNLQSRAKYKIVRPIVSNLPTSGNFIESCKGLYRQFRDPQELTQTKGADIFYDEISTDFDSSRYRDTPLEVKRMIQQHRKRGLDFYCSTQDFLTIDIAFRRRTRALFYCSKLFGSRSPHQSLPPVKKPWGLCLVREVPKRCFAAEAAEYEFVGTWSRIFFDDGLLIIRRKWTQTYDTLSEISRGEYPPLQHIEQVCELHGIGCDHKKIIHR